MALECKHLRPILHLLQTSNDTDRQRFSEIILNGEDADHLSALGMKFDPHAMPLMYDKEKFHIARGDNKGKNFLYADGHIKNLLVVVGTIQSSP